MLAHNGEINTLRGNRNWMRAREMQLASPLFGDDIKKLLPLLSDDISDSASLDRVMELLVMGGRSPAHAISMMIPEAYSGRPELHQRVRDFYAYHSSLIEPWDGPAAVAFTDGRVIGATLDRNGLRPGRWLVTRDGWVALASETGVLDVESEDVQAKGRLRPGKLFLVDVEKGTVLSDAAVKRELAERRPYGQWLDDRVVHLEDLPPKTPRVPRVEPLRAKQLAFGWSEEDLRVLLAPMARDAAEPTASMGNDASLAVLSDRRPPLFSYFKQLFAQVTNPAVDPIRESVVMSLQATIGPEVNLLDETSEHCHQLVMPQPLLFNNECERLRQVDHSVFEARTIDMTWPVEEGPDGMERRLDEICEQASELVAGGVNIIILSDRNLGPERAAIPSLLATGAVHHHLVREGTRLQIGLVVETGEAREVHHIACLIGYGASAVNPYVMFESLTGLHRDGMLPEDMTNDEAHRRVVKAIGKGLLKVLSKMGISTDPLLLRRADLRGGGRRQGASSTVTSPAPPRAWAASAWTTWPARRWTATRAPTRPRSRSCCPPAASTPGAATASSTAGTPRRWPPSSTPRGATTAPRRRTTSASPATSTRRPCASPRCAGCCATPTASSRSSWTRWSRPRRSSSGSSPAACRSARCRRRPTRCSRWA